MTEAVNVTGAKPESWSVLVNVTRNAIGGYTVNVVNPATGQREAVNVGTITNAFRQAIVALAGIADTLDRMERRGRLHQLMRR